MLVDASRYTWTLVLVLGADEATSLPWWIWPPALVIIGLGVAAAYLNQKGYWASGRELRDRLAAQDVAHGAEIKAKDEQIETLKGQVVEANGRWQVERDQRIEDARAMAYLQQASREARLTMSEVAEGLGYGGGGDAYGERIRPPRGRAPKRVTRG